MNNYSFLTGNFNSCNSRLWKLRLFICNLQPRLCLSPTEKQRIVNHMIIFNDLVSKFYQCSVRNSPRQSANDEAFAETYLCFLLSASVKKNTEAIKFLGIFKNYVFKNKIYFCLKKTMFPSIKKLFFVFHTIFKLDFVTQIISCIIHRCLFSLFIENGT